MADFELTSYSNGFGIFNKVADEEFDVINKNHLRLFMLNTENKLFNYDELYDYILPNITKYVFSRKRLSEIEDDPQKRNTIILEAINHLRAITSEADKGAGGELGEILLYLFLEQDLKAPKLFSKVEFKTNRMDYIKGSDAIHFKFRVNEQGKEIMQLVIGEAKIKNDLDEGIKSAFDSIKQFLTENLQDRILLDTHLMDQFTNQEEAEIIKDYILSIPRKKKETIFGIFIGYSSDYTGITDTNDQYAQRVIEENIKQVINYKSTIINKINEHHVTNYEFNFYFLPFHDAARDRKAIMDSITKGNAKLEWGKIKNG